VVVADLVGPFAWACCLTVVPDLVDCQLVVAENDATRTIGLGRP